MIKRSPGEAKPKGRRASQAGSGTPEPARDDRKRVLDPANQYPSEDLLRVERAALEVLEILPDAILERTRDVIVLTVGADEGIVVLVTPEAIEVRLPTVEWTGGAYGPAASSVLWRRVDREELGAGELAALLESARLARRAAFVPCAFCRARTPAEHRIHDMGEGRFDEDGARIADVCHGCASKHMGVVF